MNNNNEITEIQKWKNLVISDLDLLNTAYDGKPIALCRLLDDDVRFPKKLRKIFGMIYLRQDHQGNYCNRFILTGPRGGGKTKILGNLGFSFWFNLNYNVLDLAGSFNQAKELYDYFTLLRDEIIALKSDLIVNTKTETRKSNKKYFKAVPASPKQVRGPHPNVLIIDEACETDDNIILSALPMVKSSKENLIVMSSTFHKLFGYFQTVWDNAKSLGYCRISWDIFDVCEVFDPKIWEDPQLNSEIPDLELLKQRAKGRNGDLEGWWTIESIIQSWREKESIDNFDVEYMGSRPSARGLANDPVDVDIAVYGDDEAEKYKYRQGAEVIGALDWGFEGMTAFAGLMDHIDGLKVAIENKSFTRTKGSVIYKYVGDFCRQHGVRKIYTDISHPFQNAELQLYLNKEFKKHSFIPKVIPVATTTNKEDYVANYQAYFQNHLFKIHKSYTVAISQHKNLKLKKNSNKTVKENDHFPDATMYGLSHWPLNKNRFKMKKDINKKDKGSLITGGLINKTF